MKIPQPRRRGNAWSISVMLNGKREYCTRDTEKECTQWAVAQKILEKENQDVPVDNRPQYTFKELFDKYYKDEGRHKKSKPWIYGQLKNFNDKFGILAEASIYDITPKHLTNWRNSRSKEVNANTVLKEMSLYSAIFSYAQKELFILDTNPFFSVSKPKKPKSRDRRITDDEIDKIITAFHYSRGQVPVTPQHYVAWGFLFAIETAMRRGELLNIKMNDVFEKYVHLPDTKNGEARNVPLTPQAREMLKLIQHDGDKLIPQSENAFRLLFERTKAKIGLSDLHFHDTRHEAITRLVNQRKVPVEILAKITGHRTIKILLNTYYNPHADDIADML